jgi:hypothetical protein
MPLTSWIAGGSGMLLSLEGARILAGHLYPTCHVEDTPYNDMALGQCAWRLGVPQVMCPLFDFHGRVLNTNNREVRVTEAMAYVTVHKVVDPARMRQLYAHWRERVQPWWDAGHTGRGAPPSPPPKRDGGGRRRHRRR